MQFLFDSLLAAFNLIVGFDPHVYHSVWISFKVAIYAVFFAACVGVPAGLLVASQQFWGRQAVLLLLNTLMALPTVVVGLIFYGIFSRQGPLGAWGLLFTPAGISVGLSVLALPIVMNLSIAAIQGLDKRLFLTVKLLGATPLQQGWMILREARFAVMASIVMAFGRVISEVGVAMMLGGNIKDFTRTMTTAIALETAKGEFELGIALGVFLLLIALGVNAALFVLQRTKG